MGAAPRVTASWLNEYFYTAYFNQRNIIRECKLEYLLGAVPIPRDSCGRRTSRPRKARGIGTADLQ